MCEISIIVPVYKVEPYLRKCVDSILAQTFTNFEVILVDDGSPDNSGKICDEYAIKDSRVRVIHKENGGLSSARNAGIDIAQGKYLGFVDSDDYIAEDMYEVLYENLKFYDADISSVEIIPFRDDKYENTSKEKKEILLNKKEAIKSVLEGTDFYAYAWNKLYRKELFYNNRYLEGETFEDAYIIIDILLEIDKIIVSNEEKYFYLQRNDSIMGQKFSKKTLDVIKAWQYNQKKILSHFPDLKDSYNRRLCWAYFYVLDKLILSSNYKQIPETKEIIEFLKKNRNFILSYKGFTKSRKIAIVALSFGSVWYKKLVEYRLKKLD
ncbi:glycosyltransferase family 2 protein [Enterococcus faecalis]|nr:glycosyltransferase family 2 protein [Enterococcus faecalis]